MEIELLNPVPIKCDVPPDSEPVEVAPWKWPFHVSRSWPDLGLREVVCRGADPSEMDLEQAVPGWGFVWAARVVVDPVVLGVLDQIQTIADLGQLWPLEFQRFEPTLA